MSCGVALALALVVTPPETATALAAPVASETPASIATEALFQDIVTRSQRLKATVNGWIAGAEAVGPDFPRGEAFLSLKAETEALAALDMRAHHELAARQVDGDLKCILRGIAEDMPKRIAAIETSQGPERAVALSELAYLLDDNAAVILAPPHDEAQPAG